MQAFFRFLNQQATTEQAKEQNRIDTQAAEPQASPKYAAERFNLEPTSSAFSAHQANKVVVCGQRPAHKGLTPDSSCWALSHGLTACIEIGASSAWPTKQSTRTSKRLSEKASKFACT